MLDEQELESIYNLLHSKDESNVEIALTIIENREDVKRVFEQCRNFMKSTFYKVNRGYGIMNYTYEDLSLQRLKNTLELQQLELKQAYSKIYGK